MFRKGRSLDDIEIINLELNLADLSQLQKEEKELKNRLKQVKRQQKKTPY